MKKALKVLLAVACIAVMSVALSACSLFGVPKVKGCTYEYDRTDCDTSELSFADRIAVNSKLSGYRNGISTLVFSEDGTVDITSVSGKTTTYKYKQVGADVIVPGGPNENTQYQGNMVLGLSVTKDSNEVLKWHIALITGDGATIDVNLYYNIVSETDTPQE